MPRTRTHGVAGVIAPHTPAAAQATTPPADRGRLYYDHEIADAFFGGLPAISNKLRWVREHLPRSKRIKIGRASCWYEADIRAYIAALEGALGGAERVSA